MALILMFDGMMGADKIVYTLDVDMDRGAGYRNTLSWTDRDKPKIDVQAVEVQDDLDLEKFYKMFVDLFTAPTPKKN